MKRMMRSSLVPIESAHATIECVNRGGLLLLFFGSGIIVQVSQEKIDGNEYAKNAKAAAQDHKYVMQCQRGTRERICVVYIRGQFRSSVNGVGKTVY